MRSTDPVTAMYHTIGLLAYLARMLDRYREGEMTPEQLAGAYDALSVRHNPVLDVFEDAKAVGGYDA